MFHAEIEATNHCNIRCLHCPHEAISRPRGQMEWETYETIVRKIRTYVNGEKFSLSFSGMGEPLLNPLIYRFIGHVSRYAITSFASNGSALTEQNILKLIEAGLDEVYLSFNGDEPDVYFKMMGGLSYDRVLRNLRKAIELSNGSRLKIKANVSVTKANQDRVSRIGKMLEDAGVVKVIYSLCHSRGGNLRDPSVCDTPPMQVEPRGCDVMKNTLFLDWRGQAFICDHDLHGDHTLGDLMTDSLETILERRKKLLDEGLSFQICRECNDIMRIGDSPILKSGAGGIFRDWIYDLYKETDDPLSHATAEFKWIYRIYEKEKRLDRLVNRLLEVEQSLQAELATVRRSKTWRIVNSAKRARVSLARFVNHVRLQLL
jgi:sulfatase maturation enzyme AslB (radical SAM superfamily)